MLRRRDASSVYTVAGSRMYTSAAILAAEQHLLRLAGRRDGRAVPATVVKLALLEQTANGITLNAGQVQLVRELATSGTRLQLALAPAGTGKTTAMRVLARAWRDGGGQVLGLAPSAAAAAVLRRELDSHTDTLAKLQHALAVHADTGRPLPDWVARIGPDTLVVIDEAAMAAITDLAAVATYVTGRGGSVRLIGDDQQLAAIGAGGVLRDIAETHGAVSLSQWSGSPIPPKAPPAWPCAPGMRPRSATTPTAVASASGTWPPPSSRPTLPGPPTSPPAGTPSCWPRPASWSPT